MPSTRVANGKVIFNPGPTGSVALLNDFVLRPQTREDVTISMTIEADTGPGLAGLQFWNSLPPTYDSANWYMTAPKIQLGIDGGRVYVGVFDGPANHQRTAHGRLACHARRGR